MESEVRTRNENPSQGISSSFGWLEIALSTRESDSRVFVQLRYGHNHLWFSTLVVGLLAKCS